MNKHYRILAGLLICGGNLSASAEDHTVETNVAEAQVIVQQFAGQLKPALQAAMAEGGQVNAINVCAERHRKSRVGSVSAVDGKSGASA